MPIRLMSVCLATPCRAIVRSSQAKRQWKRPGRCWIVFWWSTIRRPLTKRAAGALSKPMNCWAAMVYGTTLAAVPQMKRLYLFDQQYGDVDQAQYLRGDGAKHHAGDRSQPARTHDDGVGILLFGIVGDGLRDRANQHFFLVWHPGFVEQGLGGLQGVAAFFLVEGLDIFRREISLHVAGHDGRIRRDQQQLGVSRFFAQFDGAFDCAARVLGTIDGKKDCLHCCPYLNWMKLPARKTKMLPTYGP